MSDDFEVGGENQIKIRSFQRDYVIHEVMHAHRRASGSWAFVVKKVFTFIYF